MNRIDAYNSVLRIQRQISSAARAGLLRPVTERELLSAYYSITEKLIAFEPEEDVPGVLLDEVESLRDAFEIFVPAHLVDHVR